jgi:acetyl esterase/lipase
MACSVRSADRPGEPLESQVDRDVPYTSRLTVDVYYPESKGLWPVAVVLHGGEDHKETMTGYAQAAARQGVVVFVPEWRSFPAQLEEHRLAAIEDVACAVRFARERAGDYGGDGARIVMAGWSLGANFAAIAVLRDDPVEGHCVVGPDVSSLAQGLVGLDGAYDFAELILADPNPPVSWTMDEVNEISAHTYVRTAEGDDPPAFRLFSGIEEQLHAQAERFRDDLQQAGYDVELVRHSELSHSAVIFAAGTVDALVDLAFG